MSTSFNTTFHATELGAHKNGRRICPINDDLVLAYTLATPQNSLCTRRSHRYDA